MKDVYLDHFSYAVGEQQRTVEESSRSGLLFSPASTLYEAGFRQHHICRPETTAYDLAYRAVEKVRGELDGVGAIVYSTCIPINGNIGSMGAFQETRDVKHLMDFPASHLQADFALEEAKVFGLSQQACTGMLGSIVLARMLLSTEERMEAVLCVSSDRFPEGALYEQSYNLISDGASACIASKRQGAFRVIAADQVTNGALARAGDDETVGNFFTYAHRTIVETLASIDLRPQDVGWVVPQNMNPSAWKILARLVGIDVNRVYAPSLAETAHVISGDNIINLIHLLESGQLRSGDSVLLFMAGYGLNWQCVVLEKV